MSNEIHVTDWASCATPPLMSGVFQVHALDNPDAILWACWSEQLKRWGAPSNSPQGAYRYQFIPWSGRNSEWRSRAN